MKLTRLALAVAALPLAAFAATDLDTEAALKLSDSVITANRGAQSKADTTAAVSVFNREDIDRLQPVNVADLLSRVPGVQVRQSGGRGSLTGVFIRGTSTAQSLVLIDGVRVGSATAGGANGALEHLNIEQIERVEVLRGSRSAVYGADAIGGVIQIFTRRGDDQGLTPRVRYAIGNKGVQERSVGLSGGNEKTRFNLGYSNDEAHGFDRTRRSWGSDQDHDTYRNKAISLNLSHAFTEDFSVGGSLLQQKGKNEYDNPAGRFDMTSFQSVAARPYDTFQSASGSLFAQLKINDVWHSRLELGHNENKLSTYDKLFVSQGDFNTYRNSAAWLNTFTINEQNLLLVGIDYYKDKVRSTTAYEEKNRWNQAGFIQHRFNSEWFSTELGLRHDKNQQYGSENTWNGAVTVPVNADNSLTLSYSEGFRAPTFNDLYWPGFSNPNLRPERSASYELQLRSRLTDIVSLEASAFQTKVRDQIRYQGNNDLKNVQTRINGFEASVLHQFDTVTTSLSLSILDPRDRKTGQVLTRVAKRTLSYDIDKQLGDWSLGASWQLHSQATDAVFNNATGQTERKKIAGHGVVDLRASWQATNELGFGLRLGNIFDKKYSRALYDYQGETHGYREDRATIQASVTWTPKLL